jgi:subtilisin-like proprotein convertase family protein
VAFEALEGRTLLAIDSIGQFGVAVTENFDSMGTGTALPGAFRMVEKNATVSWATAASTVSQQASSGTPTQGGTYNWGSSASERAVGAMSSGSWASPNSLLARFTNATGSTITSLSVGFTAERYRVNTAAASVSFFASADGTNWTAVPAGDVAAASFPTGTSAYTFVGGTTVSRSNVVVGSLSVAAGAAFYLRWTLATTGSSSQGIGIDDVTITASGSTTVVAPSAPTITGITPAAGRLTVAFAPPASDGGAALTGYEYSLDGGGTWTAPSPAVTTSPFTITGLVNGQAYAVRLRAVNSVGPGAASASVTARPGTIDHLRVVSYNVTAADIAGVRTGFETLVQAMSAESYAGHVDRVDLIAMQEVQTQATTSANLVTRLNAIYGSGAYARGTLDGDTTGSGTQGVVFNTAALQLLEERAVGTASSTGAPRQAIRYKFQPVGGDATSVFYVYNAHFKAADDTESAARRAAEAQVIRADADALGAGMSILYVGDFNLQTSNELAYERLLAAGNGQAFDPIDRPGNWSNNANFRDIFTQAPLANSINGFAGGGLDDRYDFQLVSGAVMTGSGLAYKTGSYRTFGVDGSVSVNGSVNASSSTALPGLANRTQVLDLLTTVADHLPVVVDYSFLVVAEPVVPTITVSPATLAAALTTTVGTPSAAQTFTVSAAGLTGGLTVNAPTGLEVSFAAGSGYAASLALAPTAGTVASTTIYVRLTAAAAAGDYNAAAITVSGGGATTQTVLTTANGNVVSEPSSITLLAEDFASLTAGGNTASSGTGSPSSTEVTTNLTDNFPTSSKAYSAGGAVKLGSSSAAGSITTRMLDLSGNGGVFTVSFDVKGWTTVEGSITVTVTGLAPQTVSYSATMSGNFETKTLQFTGGQANATITFATTTKRAFLDTIVVSGGTPEPVVTGITGFVWDDADGDGTWDTPAEAGIAGRTVYLDLDRSGSLDLGEPSTVTATDGGYSFTGLGGGTYIVTQIVPAGWEQTHPSLVVTAATMRSASSVQVATFTDPAYVPETRLHQKRFVPNDPLFSGQWHLRNTGQQSGTTGQDANVVTAWDVAKGSGVVIGIVDDGLQWTHPDLAPGYRSDLSYDFFDDDADPSPGAGDDHGTAVAGIAAARGNNGIGVSGTAPSASVAGIRLTSAETTDQTDANALTYKSQDIAIYSNSWGPADDGSTLEAPGPLTRAAVANAVQTGRGGKGSIYVWAAGNGLDVNDNSNFDGYANSRYVIAVSAVDNRGVQSWYSEPGANILVAAPSSGDSSGTEVGTTTTDRTGSAGYNVNATDSPGNLSDRNYTNDFGGTSSATPLVSGVVALMLEANPNLGWRDVKHVLAASARRNAPTDAGWSQNGAGKWVNHKYGFGVVDAAAAVNLAKTWTNVGPEVSASSGTITVGQTIPDNNVAGITSSFTMGADIRMETVEVVFSASHLDRGHLQVVLTAPSGTKSVLAEKRDDAGDNYSGWVFTTVRDWGESSKGTWTITASDRTAGTTGTFGSWALNVYGTALPAPPPGTQTVTVSAGQTIADVNFGSRSVPPATPTIGTTGAVVALATTVGTASAAGTVTVTGSDLTEAITATAPSGFEVSSDGVNYGPTATFAQADGAASGTLHVRLAATTAVGTYSGDVTLSSSGATTATVAVPASRVTNPPVKVKGVYVRGSGWGTNYLNLSSFTTIGADRLGWQLRDGANQLATSGADAAQVTWNNVNTISVLFDQAIAKPEDAALRLVAKRLTSYSGSTPVQADVTLESSTVSLLGDGTVAQFVLPSALATGKYVLSLAATAITDAAVSTVLNGEWVTGSSTFAAGSGDGTAGGMFTFAFNVLVGDLNADGTANSGDLTSFKNQMTRTLGTPTTAGTFRYDLNGDGSLNSQDVGQFKTALIRTLGMALAPLASPPAPTAAAATLAATPTSANVTSAGASLGGDVTGDGGEPVLERGVVLLAGTTGTPVKDDPGTITLLSAGALGVFTVDFAGLSAATPYRFRSFVRTSQGLVYSDVATFTTAAA